MVVSEKQRRNLYVPAMFVELDCTKKCWLFLRVFFCAELVVAMVILFRLAKYVLDKHYF